MHGPDLAQKVNDLCYLFTGSRPPLSDPALAGAELSRALGEQSILLIVDDVWSRAQLEPFLLGGSATVRLVTTRRHSLLPDGSRTVDVDAMRSHEAEQLLLAGLGAAPPGLVRDLLRVTGRWPVLLALVNGAARADQRAGREAYESLRGIGDQLRAGGPAILDVTEEGQRHAAVAATIQISLHRLTPDQRARYLKLAVFPEDIDIPGGVLERYWSLAGGFTAFETHRFCQQLADLSLALDYRLDPPRLRLHDVLRSYLRHHLGDQLIRLDEVLVDAHRELVPNEDGRSAWWLVPAEETYLWSWLAAHLYAAGLHQERAGFGDRSSIMEGWLEPCPVRSPALRPRARRKATSQGSRAWGYGCSLQRWQPAASRAPRPAGALAPARSCCRWVREAGRASPRSAIGALLQGRAPPGHIAGGRRVHPARAMFGLRTSASLSTTSALWRTVPTVWSQGLVSANEVDRRVSSHGGSVGYASRGSADPRSPASGLGHLRREGPGHGVPADRAAAAP